MSYLVARARAAQEVLASAQGRWVPTQEVMDAILRGRDHHLLDRIWGRYEATQDALRYLERNGIARRTREGVRVDHWQLTSRERA